MSNRVLKRDQKSFSTLELDSPVDLYWLHRPKTEEEPAKLDKTIDTTEVSEVFWDDFVIVAKAVKILDPEATIYDAFNFIREHMMGGWTYLEDTPAMKKLDEEIEREYKKELRKGKWNANVA